MLLLALKAQDKAKMELPLDTVSRSDFRTPDHISVQVTTIHTLIFENSVNIATLYYIIYVIKTLQNGIFDANKRRYYSFAYSI